MRLQTVLGSIVLLLAGCQAQTPEVRQPVPLAPQPLATATSPVEANSDAQYFTAPPEERQAPPPAAEPPAWTFPEISESVLPNGLALKLLRRDTLPLVQVELVVQSGQGSDGNKPGLAVIAGEMLKVGGSGPYASRQLLDRIESLGSSLSVTTRRDSTHFSLQVTSDHFDDALGLLGLLIQQPQFSADEFRKLKRREMDRVSSLGKSSADWVSNMVVYRELFGADHPYAAYDGTSQQIEQVQLWEAKAWHKQHVSPKNAFLVVAGDVTSEQLSQAAKGALGGWRGGPAPVRKVPVTRAPEALRLFVVDRPESPQAEVRWVTLGPERQSADWVSVKVSDQVIGGGVSGRLFMDVREKRSLAYSTNSAVLEVASGPAPLMLRAGTQTAKAGLALQALLEHAQLIASTPPTQEEINISTRYLSDVFLLRLETVSAMASLTASLGIYGLPNDYYDKYRALVRQATPTGVHEAASRYYAPQRGIVVVAGDAERLAPVVSHFGEVRVLDPNKGFSVVKTLPHNPAAAIELERIDGT
ncbi:MAG: hypothetical protein RJA70_800 [Pseudomonadota bacterium]|jgi:predicted Zn-dependent peptidase